MQAVAFNTRDRGVTRRRLCTLAYTTKPEDGSAATYGTTREIAYNENPIYALREFGTMNYRDRSQLSTSRWTDVDTGREGWDIVFRHSPRASQRNVLTVLGGRLQCANGAACGAKSSRRTPGSPPLAGTFTVGVTFPNGSSATTPPLDYDAADDVVKSAVDRLYGRSVAFVDKSSGHCPFGCTWEMTFHGVDADMPPVTVDTSGLTGGRLVNGSTTARAVVTTVLDYSEDYQVLYPIPGDMLETVETAPQAGDHSLVHSLVRSLV